MRWLRSERTALSEPRVLALMSSAIVLNIVGGETINALKLPIYGDSAGTILAGILGGPVVGGLTGALGNVVWGLLRDPKTIAFAPVGLVIGVLAGVFARRGWLVAWQGDDARRSPLGATFKSVLAGLAIGALAALVSTPIAAVVYGGVTGGPTDVLVAAFRGYGASVWQAVLGQATISDPLDKLATMLVAMSIVAALPRRIIHPLPYGARLLGGTADEPAP